MTQATRIRDGLYRAHGKLLLAADRSSVGVVIHANGGVVELNAAAARILRAPCVESVRGRRVLELLRPEQRLSGQAQLADLTEPPDRDVVWEVLRQDGVEGTVPVLVVASLPLSVDNEELAMMMFVDAHAQRAQVYETARLHGRGGAFSLDPRARTVRLSGELQALLGLPETPALEAVLARIHPEDLGAAHEALAGQATNPGPICKRYRVRVGDGRIVRLETHAQSFDDDGDGFCESIRGASREITEEEGLAEAESRFRALFDGSPDAMLVVDERGTIVMANRNAEALLVNGGPLVGASVEAFVPPQAAADHAERRASYHRHSGNRMMGVGAALPARTADGRTVPTEIRLGHATLDGRRVAIVSLRDVSERERLARDDQTRRTRAAKRHALLVALTRDASSGLRGPDAIAQSAAEELDLAGAAIFTFASSAGSGAGAGEIPGEALSSPVAQLLTSGECRTRDVLSDQRFPFEWRSAFFAGGGPALIARPLFDGHSLAGALCFYGDATQTMLEDEQAFATAVAALVSLRLELERRRAAEAAAASRMRELDAARKSAVTADRAKSEFLAAMSHEIRTPMHAALGYCDLLAATPLSHEQHAMLNVVKVSGAALMSLVDDILDFSRVAAGRLEIDAAPFDVRALCNEVALVLDPQAREKRLALDVSVQARVPAWLVGDSRRLRQVLLNLAGNALKFTEQGSVKVEVELLEAPLVGIRVTDTGAGISRENLGKLFQRFMQVSEGTARRHGGAGLGLAISRALVEAMGGSIGATSELGRGSCFWLVAPLPAAASPAQPAVITAVARDYSGARVLVADDNVVNQRLLARMLELCGCVVDVVDNGLEAVQRCREKAFDLIMMDCHMPELDGFDATVEIRRREDEGARPRTPVVAVTASVLDEDRQRGEAVGMDGFLTKPLRETQLRAALAAFLHPHKQVETDPLSRA